MLTTSCRLCFRVIGWSLLCVLLHGDSVWRITVVPFSLKYRCLFQPKL